MKNLKTVMRIIREIRYVNSNCPAIITNILINVTRHIFGH